jgi:uncharacterized protein (TIGR02594 family)
MADRDIIARLSLNAQDFASANSAAFAQMEQRAADTAKRTQSAFESSFAAINQIASQALASKPTSSGALNLGVDEYRQAAAAAQQHASALRQILAAAEAVAAAEQDQTEQTRLSLQAARAASVEAENDARAKMDEVRSLELLQAELNRTAAGQRSYGAAVNSSTGGANNARIAQFELMHVITASSDAYASGIPITRIFTMEMGRAAEAVSFMSAGSGRLAGFLGGPWGIAITLAVTGLASMIAGMKQANQSLDDMVEKLKEDAAKSDLSREAHDAFTKTLEGQIEAQRKLNEEMEKGIQTQHQLDEQNLQTSQDRLASLRRDLGDTQRQLATARQELTAARGFSAPGSTTGGLSLDVGIAAQKVQELQDRSDKLRTAIGLAAEGVRAATVSIASIAAKDAVDPIARINQKYDDMAAAAKKAALGNDQLAHSLQGTLTQVEKNRQADIKAEQEAERAGKGRPDASAIEGQQILAAARGYVGTRETGSGRGVLEQLFSEANIHLDPEKLAWCAAFVNAILSQKGLPESASPTMAKSFLNYGSAVDKPEPGDIVILKGGAGHDHVGFFVGNAGPNRINVLGGNQGNAVGTESFATSDVLGFRRAPSLGEVATDQAKQAQLALDAHNKLVVALDKEIEKTTHANQIEAMKRQGLEEQAAIAQAINAVDDQHLDIAGKTAEEIAKEKGIRVEQAQVEIDLLHTLEQQAATRARQTYEDQQAKREAAAFTEEIRKIGRAEEEQMRKVQEERRQQVQELADFYETAFQDGASGVWKDFKRQGMRVISEIAAEYTLALLSGQKSSLGNVLADINTSGGQQGAIGSVLLSGIGKLFGATAPAVGQHIGGLGDTTGEPSLDTGGRLGDIAGFLGSVGGPAAAGGAAGGIGGLLASAGSFFPPMAAALAISSSIASVLGIKSFAGGMFGLLGDVVASLLGGNKVKRGAATLGVDQFGNLDVGGTAGNTGKYKSAASDALGQVIQDLDSIAQQLGGDVSGPGSVSIGIQNGNYRVDPTGRGITAMKKGAIDFGTDENAAVAYAVSQAIQDGVITGISDAAKHILESGKSLDQAIQEAALVDQIPKLLKAHLDPVGAAIDDLNAKWKPVWQALKDGAASAELMAQAQQEYNLELDDAKKQAGGAADSLKAFLDSLNFGSSSPLSLRDQESSAKAALQPFLDKIGGGQTIDQQAYQSAAQAYLDIERQLYGSTPQYFAAFNMIKGATSTAIDSIQNAQPISTPTDAAALATADNTAATADNTADIATQMKAMNDNMAQMIQFFGSAAPNGFIGSGVGFAKPA